MSPSSTYLPELVSSLLRPLDFRKWLKFSVHNFQDFDR